MVRQRQHARSGQPARGGEEAGRRKRRLLQRNQALGADVLDLKHGDQAVEARARTELGLIKPGEMFYQVVEKPAPVPAKRRLPPATAVPGRHERAELWCVVPAAGRGTRVGGDCPKQYLPLAGRPLIEHTLERLAAHPRIAGLLVTLAADDRLWPGIDTVAWQAGARSRRAAPSAAIRYWPGLKPCPTRGRGRFRAGARCGASVRAAGGYQQA